ncbi:MAG: DNA-processing protein DprA [Gemmatimonadales bacterium]
MGRWLGSEREAWLALALVPGVGASRLRALLDRFETPSGALGAPFELVRSVPGMVKAAATALCMADRGAAREALAHAERLGAKLLIPGDEDFPPRLLEIPEPPPALFALGSLSLLARPAVAIVGSRDHSAYGGEVARRLGREAAVAGLVVVSGMARGLDALAHAGALEATGATIGVLGNGLGVVYPAANRRLYRAVIERGLLITEFPPGERPVIGAFPRRNRIISGLARVTVVVEAAQASGALQTVQCALEQGRDVMAVPGPITSGVSRGTNGLIRDGCEPMLETEDLLRHYPEIQQTRMARVARTNAEETGMLPVSGSALEARLCALLRNAPRALAELCDATDRPPAEVLDMLTALELAGTIRGEAGGCFALSASRRA